MDLHLPETGPSFFIATPEKALADKVNQFFALDETRGAGLYDLLVHNLRIEPSSLSSLDYSLLEEISQVYRSRKVSALAEFVRKLQKKGSTQ
jgi:chemotaxis protein CheY-P-specific phosphatase CheC